VFPITLNNDYPYMPINEAKREIRLLKILPRSLKHEGKLKPSSSIPTTAQENTDQIAESLAAGAEEEVSAFRGNPLETSELSPNLMADQLATIDIGEPHSRYKPTQIKTETSSILCELVHVSLDDPDLTFEALSYLWGAQAPSFTIYIGQCVFGVGPNLIAALQALQLSDAVRYVWIDAICINQADKDERSQQVALMRNIYIRATGGIIVWLGEPKPSEEKALSFLS
jgi:hypothetical protein